MIEPIDIGGRTVSQSEPCFIVAEAGTAHNGDLNRGIELIDAAVDAGADCVKFQAVRADEIVHPNCGAIALPGGRISIYDTFAEIERDEAFFRSLCEHCRKRSITFLCAPFGLETQAMLARIGVPAYKIASPELNHFPLIDACASAGVPCIVSTGVSLLSDIEAAVDRLTSAPVSVALLHCVTNYPAPPAMYNLRVVESLRQLFGLHVGVSDHTLQTDLVPVLAVSVGASIIEKHITLSKRGAGLDDPLALSPVEFGNMVEQVRMAESDPDTASLETTRRYGHKLVEAVLGDGVKRLASSEAEYYHTTNRSIISIRRIGRGEAFSRGNVRLLRSETNIEPGLPPRFLDEILKRRAFRDIRDGAGITWADVGERDVI